MKLWNQIKKLPLIALLLFSLAAFAHAETPQKSSNDQIWKFESQAPNKTLDGGEKVMTILKQATEVQFDTETFLAHIAGIPKEASDEVGVPVLEISIPKPDGSFEAFLIIESPVMAPELAAKFPEIRTFRGHSLDDPTATIRLGINPKGFHASVLSSTGSYYIDRLYKGNKTLYACYTKKDLIKPGTTETLNKSGTPITNPPHRCGFQAPPKEVQEAILKKNSGAPHKTTSGTTLRTYRLAMAATGEYTQYHGGTVALGLASINTGLARINQIYEKDLTVRLILVSNNNSIIYTNGATDPYDNSNDGLAIIQNQSNLDSVIGSSNYDIGHVLKTGGAGLAGFQAVCNSFQKGEATTGSPTPVNDPFWVDYVAHEIGHQFGANHTWSYCGGASDADGVASYEPGSGSTIMGYANLCGSDNLQSSSDPYFHSISLEEIQAYIATTSCAVTSATSNNVPTVSAGNNYTIPKETPFTLTGTANDSDGDTLEYCWEQRDIGPAQSLSQMVTTDNGQSPIFRSWAPTSSSSRTFPRLSNLLTNTLPTGERLPSVDRNMNFRLVVRDNKGGGGGVNTDDMIVTVEDNAGPFLITAPNTSVTWTTSPQTITWDVANTTAAPVSCSQVNILLSTDGGNTFPTTLATATANDGTESVTIPATNTTTARIKVEAVGSIFFDLSNSDFTINISDPVMAISSISVSGNTVNMNFDTDTTSTYKLRKSTNLSSWSDVETFSATASVTKTLSEIHGTLPARLFYRVEKQ